MKESTVNFFASIDLPLINVYGMTESSGPTTSSNYSKFHLIASGFAISGTDLIIHNPDANGDGEICFRGRHIMMGYLKNEVASLGTLDKDGFLHSGDIGRIDKDGFLFITGRIKELIITAGGENIAPVLIEDQLKSICPVISNVIAVGEQQRFIAALITFKVDIDSKGNPTNKLAMEATNYFQSNLKVTVETTEEAIANPKVQAYIAGCIEESNSKLVSRAAMIKKWEFLAVDFSQAGDELTPTLKLRRKVTEAKHKALIDKMYTEAKI
jgi:long-chain-fatty-acid--CoA ligase ACSBG